VSIQEQLELIMKKVRRG